MFKNNYKISDFLVTSYTLLEIQKKIVIKRVLHNRIEIIYKIINTKMFKDKFCFI